MSSRFKPVLVTAFLSLTASAQQPASPPPVPAGAAKPAVPVAPPMPGQVKAEPASAPSLGRLPDLPPPAITPVPPTPLNKSEGAVPSTSGSGQFIVHGNDLRLRNAFSARCDEIKDELSRLLRDPQPWVLPVVVLLNSGEGARLAPRSVSTSLAEVAGGGFHLQVTVNLRPDLRSQDLRAEVMRALLLERILRSQPAVTSKRTLLLPEWMQVGVIKALDFRKQARPSTLFAAIFKSGRIFGIEEIIESSPTQMDALSRTIYDTSCCALVLALLDQPDGSARLNRFLASLATDRRSERELLNLAFPSFASSKASLNKWWALQLANLSRPGVSEPLTPAETLKALEEALTLRYQAKPSEIPQPRAVPALASLATPEKERERVMLEPDPAVLVPVDKDEADEPGRLRSFISMLNPFASRRKASNAAIIESVIEQAAIQEARSQEDQSIEVVNADVAAPVAASEGPRTSTSDERKGFFNRWFGGGDASDKEKSQDDKIEKRGEESPSQEVIPAGRSSRWNPLNWFRRDKEVADPAETAPGLETSSLDFWRDEHLTALVMQQELVPATPPADAKPTVAVEVPEEKTQPKKRGLLGIFGSGKKKKEKESPSSEPMPAPAAEPAPAGADADKPKSDKEESKSKSDSDAPKKSPSEPAPAKGETAAVKKGESIKTTLVPAQAEPPAAAPVKPEGQAMNAGEAAAEATATPMPAGDDKPETASSEASGKRGSVTLKRLFGFGKKPEKPEKTTEPEPMPAGETPPGENKDKMAAGADATSPGAEGKKELPASEKTTDSKAADDKPKKSATSKAGTEKAVGKKVEKPKAEVSKPAAKPEPKVVGEQSAKAMEKSTSKVAEKTVSKPAAKPEPKVVGEQSVKAMEKSTPKVVEKPVSKPVEKPEPAKPTPEPPKPASSPAPAMVEKPAAPAPKVEPPQPPKSVEKPKDEPLVAAAVPIEDYAAILKRPDRREILRHNLAALSALQHRSSVLLRPVVTEYTALVAELMEGKAKNVDERLQRLRERSKKAYEQSRAVRDLLDVHEANSASAMSGAFEDYLKLPERIQEELPPRQDAISRYLDALDLEFSKP